MSHFLNVRTQIREREHLITALRDLHYRFQASEREDLLVRGYQGNSARAEIVVDTGSEFDIGFQRRPDAYEVVADWWGVQKDTQIQQQTFIQQLNRQYSYNVIRDQAREQDMVLQEEREMENGDLVITLSERG